MESCEHRLDIRKAPAPEWFATLHNQITKPCEFECPDDDDVVDYEPLQGRKVIVSANLAQGKHCFELETLVKVIQAKPEDPLKSGGSSKYTLEDLKSEMEQGLQNGKVCQVPVRANQRKRARDE
jgi:hypothetical protein